MDSLVPPPPGSGKGLMERVEDSLLPLINLVFLLLMFFIVAGQLSNDPLPQLPAMANQGEQQQPAADLVIQPDGRWQVKGTSVGVAELRSQLPAPSEQQPLRIAAARDLAMSELETLLSHLEAAGYTDIILLTEPSP
ncbi:ExbD/TolR family protein [Marinobacter sp. SS21]|uniref:ExbD/TolR family protein n=1 Tax=Marinobacter sp. SS21 TaxID=2979460 RepID=UPI00232F13DD|nr:biopolymer transporter ExbD [Marinobacter sp. SS21]MDC0661129.1 biopolymer transporter ExbD [Marinobacter sp. SS21]